MRVSVTTKEVVEGPNTLTELRLIVGGVGFRGESQAFSKSEELVESTGTRENERCRI